MLNKINNYSLSYIYYSLSQTYEVQFRFISPPALTGVGFLRTREGADLRGQGRKVDKGVKPYI